MKKRWFIVLLVLIVIGVVLAIVFVNLFREKDTKALQQSFHETVTNDYLSEKKQDDINFYLAQVRNSMLKETEDYSKEIAEISNLLAINSVYTILGDFFDSQLVYTVYSDAYRDNRGKVEDCLKTANESAQKIISNAEATKDIQSSQFWTANSYANVRNDVKTTASNTVEAFNKLFEIYKGSVSSKFMNNELTDAIWLAIQDLSGQAIADFEKCDVDGPMDKLKRFVSAYFSDIKTIILFHFNQDYPKIEDIKEKGKESEFYDAFLSGEYL